MNISQIDCGDTRIVCPKSIAPLRLLRCDGHGGRWPVRWHVVYPDGEINEIAWARRIDAIGQANIALPYHRKETGHASHVPE